MINYFTEIIGANIEIHSVNTVVVGSGAAGFNAADRIYSFGQRDVILVTEGINMGTSRNTGSDKQTYYKLTLSGDKKDSVYDMAKTLFEGGSMDGDISLVEAALSPQCFYRLVDIGVPFPHNRYGEYIGYKTDHDPGQRATSVGPLTSKLMTEKLEKEVMNKGIQVFDGYQVVGILTNKEKNSVLGLLALNMKELQKENKRYTLFNCRNVVYATGGPASIYQDSVYPESHTGTSGIAYEAGVKGKNVTESQFGIASTKFRWNLSGTYQQVLPRYISTNQDGSDEKEFLDEYFSNTGKMLDAIFLKGYQWPFDPRKIQNEGSSLIDILVYQEKVVKGRRIYLDFMNNPSAAINNGEMNFKLLGEEAHTYLKNSGALFGKPIERLAYMNQPAIDLYWNNGIDITKEYLEIAVCAQHNNGGLKGDIWWQSNVTGFFPVGEVNGSHGVYRPGGSALNAGQVGSFRAAQYIANCRRETPLPAEEFIMYTSDQIQNLVEVGQQFLSTLGDTSNVLEIRKEYASLMTQYGGVIRNQEKVKEAIKKVKVALKNLEVQTKIKSIEELPYAYQNRDLLITQLVYLSAIEDYMKQGGKSRGSYLITEAEGEISIDSLSENLSFSLENGYLSSKIQEISYLNGEVTTEWREVTPLPEEESWFETIWNQYRNNTIIT
ncbi:Succinate dehydrogenase/fumarate reductase, flavoprotein subunit [Anaerovirgula multivorans]|uniref:Succinate dehydrogenase/fumarate reductase, flavoprotein subunit n=1 Tax=Anaerovirgula multivorans TaxID=312168 RepID=A0A239BTE2_9FIRM|nr:FAD-binding protein [Anaerovirgula multivorans]SNS10433.1 Succinate dehydrogenase/fumarate reductase, flavoprotein subunit [Anaerovirgula multivorans]